MSVKTGARRHEHKQGNLYWGRPFFWGNQQSTLFVELFAIKCVIFVSNITFCFSHFLRIEYMLFAADILLSEVCPYLFSASIDWRNKRNERILDNYVIIIITFGPIWAFIDKECDWCITLFRTISDEMVCFIFSNSLLLLRYKTWYPGVNYRFIPIHKYLFATFYADGFIPKRRKFVHKNPLSKSDSFLSSSTICYHIYVQHAKHTNLLTKDIFTRSLQHYFQPNDSIIIFPANNITINDLNETLKITHLIILYAFMR